MMLSILVPIYNYNAVPLVKKIGEQANKSEILFEIICWNDASTLFLTENQELTQLPGVRYNFSDINQGRSKTRNQLARMAQYDWLLFLRDDGLSSFVEELLLDPDDGLSVVKDAFLASYTGEKGGNQFTKVKIALSADLALQRYFSENQKRIENWYNIISPRNADLESLKDNLGILLEKKWEKIHV